MKITKTWAKRFHHSCRTWQAKFGLTDWSLSFAAEVDRSGEEIEAQVRYSCENRTATLVAMLGSMTDSSPEDAALHEMSHLLLADVLRVATQRKRDTHADVVREEHRVIERLVTAFGGGKK